MNKISLYIFLIIIYLGLSKTFSPQIKSSIYIQNDKFYAKFFKQRPISLILIDSFKTGFIIKTYFQKYLKVYAFGPSEEILIKTGKDFWKQNYKNRGMSLYRTSDTGTSVGTTPLPPGMIFINNPSFGTWRKMPSGDLIWRFHRAYRHFPGLLGWGDWSPTKTFYLKAHSHEKNQIAFYGPNKEFGEHGTITEASFPKSNLDKRRDIKFIKHLNELFSIPRDN